MRFPLEVAKAVRRAWPQHLPVFTRISASEWVEGGFDIGQSVAFARELKTIGIDLVDCSSGGNVAHAKIATGPSYQVPFAEEVRTKAGIATAAVGQITEARQAEDIVVQDKADAVFLARELLRDPYWPLHAARRGRDNRHPRGVEGGGGGPRPRRNCPKLDRQFSRPSQIQPADHDQPGHHHCGEEGGDDAHA